ncbi:hypothetical protein RIF23_19245 [Lipingzhangella sp. LS1_29]|uniref:Uncharacterized protein n=1 Tax=Lipingzhangella rawalii TaxID=2055835 RepID=A0ABU2HAX4_9ACTN|nr:hypothetical protein [Lipingzhangella rawalii]MDS1272428.1 hypothetical protein [Lipingzhangella rawalii]
MIPAPRHPEGSPPSAEPGGLARRAWASVDDEYRHVALAVEGTEYVFSAGARDVGTSVRLLRRLAAAAHFAAGALEQCHRELQAQREALEQAQACLPRCGLCTHPTTGTGSTCTWCGHPQPPAHP